MKNILVAGGSGFIGSHLCEKLLENKNNTVFCFDNNYSSSKKNIAHLINNPRFKFVKKYNKKISIHEKIDEIYNLASPASPEWYQKDPEFTSLTNILGNLNLLTIANRDKAKILYTSTSEVYGDPLQHPQKESYYGNVNPIGIRSCYDESKRMAESLLFDYNRKYKTKIKIVRLFNTYGPKMLKNDGRVISNFINQAIQKKPLTVYGKGSQTRSFCYVNDTVEAIIKFMNTNDKILGPVNIGNPVELTIAEIAKKINEILDNNKITYLTLPSDDPKKRKPDISLIKKYTKWKPTTKLKDGLKKTIEYFKINAENQNN